AMNVDAAPNRDPRDTMRQLQWSIAWVRDFARRLAVGAEREGAERAAGALDLLAAALEGPTARSACRGAATEPAPQPGCERVSIGFVAGGHSEIAGISHSAQFGKRMSLIRQLVDAMDEAIDQQAVVLFPAPREEEDLLVRAHAALATSHGASFILTVPM